MSSDPQAAFHGVRILDFTRNIAGPFATMMLGDLGADVIKIEEPGRGDETRYTYTFESRRPEDQDYFYVFNRNKRSVTLNLKSPLGKETFLELANRSDVLVQNYGPGVVERLGLDYDSVRRVNPRIIYCSVSGFGRGSPLSGYKAFDHIVQAVSGVMSFTGTPGSPPQRCGPAIADYSAAIVAAFAIASALFGREHSGQGQYIDIAMLDCVLAISGSILAQYLAGGTVPTGFGNEFPTRAPVNTYQAADGRHIQLFVNDRSWHSFCEVLGLTPDDPNGPLTTNQGRVAHRAELDRLIEARIRERPAQEWTQDLVSAGIPCAIVHNAAEVLEHEHTAMREMVLGIDHPVSGPVKVIGWPYKLAGTPARLSMPPPLLGEHTAEVLRDVLGYSAETIGRLSAEGAA